MYTDFDSLLITLRSLREGGEGGEEKEGEEDTGLRLLEQMLQSNTFKRAQKVCGMCTRVYTCTCVHTCTCTWRVGSAFIISLP